MTHVFVAGDVTFNGLIYLDTLPAHRRGRPGLCVTSQELFHPTLSPALDTAEYAKHYTD